MLLLEDTVAPCASIENTRMLMRFLLQAPAFALLEWRSADGGLCAHTTLELASVAQQNWLGTAALYSADRDARRRVLDAYDAHRASTPRGAHTFDRALPRLLRELDIPVTYASPVFFRWEGELRRPIDGRGPAAEPYWRDGTTTGAAVRRRCGQLFRTAGRRCGVGRRPSRATWGIVGLVVLVAGVCVACAVGGVIVASRVRAHRSTPPGCR